MVSIFLVFCNIFFMHVFITLLSRAFLYRYQLYFSKIEHYLIIRKLSLKNFIKKNRGKFRWWGSWIFPSDPAQLKKRNWNEKINIKKLDRKYMNKWYISGGKCTGSDRQKIVGIRILTTEYPPFFDAFIQ